jgi:hypothetical protein
LVLEVIGWLRIEGQALMPALYKLEICQLLGFVSNLFFASCNPFHNPKGHHNGRNQLGYHNQGTEA